MFPDKEQPEKKPADYRNEGTAWSWWESNNTAEGVPTGTAEGIPPAGEFITPELRPEDLMKLEKQDFPEKKKKD